MWRIASSTSLLLALPWIGSCSGGAGGADVVAESLDGTEPEEARDIALDPGVDDEPCIPALGCTCNPVDQCGCDDGAWCAIPRTWSCERVCEVCINGSIGSKLEGEACEEIPLSECSPGLICTRGGVDDGLACRRLCESSADCKPGEVCDRGIEIFPSTEYPGPCDYGTYITEYGCCVPRG